VRVEIKGRVLLKTALPGGGGTVAGRWYDENEGVNVKVEVTIASSWPLGRLRHTCMSNVIYECIMSHMNESCHT